MASFKSRVTVFSFILTVLVIWIHAVDFGLMSMSAAQAAADGRAACFYIQRVLGSGLGQIAVPGFFSMSGYLFFRNAGSSESLTFFTAKWKKRVRTLLMPFLIWNLIYYFVYILFGKASVNVSSALSAAVLNRYNPVFWYIRELIILTVLTPVIYLFIRKRAPGAAALFAVFAAAVFYDIFPVHVVNEDALFYYMTGAFTAMHFRSFVEGPGGAAAWKKTALICLVFFIVFECIYVLGEGHLRIVLIGAVGGRTAGYMLIFSLISLVSTHRQKAALECARTARFMSYNFFIYAIHYLEIRFFRLIFALAGMDEALTESLGFMLMPALCIAAAVICGSLMKRLTPKLYDVLTGGRE